MAREKSMFSKFEEEMLKVWEQEKTFAKSLQQREGKERFSFYDGPPYANGLPHHGHIVPVSVKDAVTRYKTMQGYFVPRRLGWDTHGLPVEYQIEKELGFKNKQDITQYGIDKFNQACRDSVFKFKTEWEAFFHRLGRWADAEHAYATFEDSYIESIWWAFAGLHKKGLVYEGYRSSPYCPRCATPLSNFEVNQGYKDNVKDPSVYIKFRKAGSDEYFLAWTTTPWSLSGNATLAVKPDETYVKAKVGKDTLILAEKRLQAVAGAKVLSKIKAKALVGARYEPLFKLPPSRIKDAKNLYKVIESKDVSIEEGTGVLHVAPAYGELDLELGNHHKLPVLHSVDENGRMRGDIGIKSVEGQFFKKADESIIADLQRRGLIYKVDESFKHTYPFCWRCETPLLYYALTSWFIKVTAYKQSLIKNNQQINWVPTHLRSGRFGKWLQEARDWAVSRNRFWGAPLPIWKCDKDHVTVVESIEQLKKLAINPEAIGDLHRPAIDDVQIKCSICAQPAKRIEEIFDVWFESGAMPYAQDHYPFENEAEFKQKFPADFIAEGMDQTRGWFYTLHALATGLFDQPAFKNVITNGWVVAADGEKLSKRLKNYTPLDEVFALYGADVLRFFMLASPVVHGEDARFGSDALKEVQRNVFMTLWNVFTFFKTYTDIDEWKPETKLEIRYPKSDNVLDHWVLARLNQTIAEVTKQADEYRLDKATRPIVDFIDDLSNWYVRRSRRRFWKSEDDKDKTQAYEILWYVLVRTCQLLAPWAPFLSDKIYRELIGKTDLPSSVHLTDWPKAGKTDSKVLTDMQETRDVITEGLAQRAQGGIKVRQPLSKVDVQGRPIHTELQSLIADELNVKEVNFLISKPPTKIKLDTKITPDLKREGLMREVVRHVQQLRKDSGLDVADRIHLHLETGNPELQKAIKEHTATIKHETLAKSLDGKTNQCITVKVEDAQLNISLQKA